MIVRITSKYGSVDSIHKTPHSGIDIALEEGTPLSTFKEGVVKHVLDYGNSNVGKGVVIEHSDGTQAIYGHLSQINVHEGEYLHEGEQFALSGNTGRSTAEHLHLGFKDAEGHVIDPSPYLDEVSKNIGQQSFWDKFVANGRVGDGIGDIPQNSVWEWFGEKAAEITVNGAVTFMSDIALALPVLTIIGGTVYVCLNMFSSGLAKWSAIGTVLYGLLVVKG
ncbi:M23 family peptidase [Peribacillus saganii]|uniref:M23 family peptidase n=1 Tax=Peribacillus saganii TaxID=2303992 RepID=A0A372LQ72_9BACI|nr:M23 family metallopeptidase [Peribacillus saganii]RFU70358.1 M23 family peptidase [Peribacillus saganii]